MKIAIGDLLPIFSTAITGFELSEEDWTENAPYFLLADMRLFLCDRAGPFVVTQLNEFSILLERLVTDGDEDVQDLVQDCLEGLLECERKDSVARFFLPRTQQLWLNVSKWQHLD